MSEWQDEIRLAYRNFETFKAFINNRIDLDLFEQIEQYPLFITPFWANHLLEKNNIALWKQFLPSKVEQAMLGGFDDPIGDKIHQKTTQLIHRYKNRVLIAPTHLCPVNCRYCFRKNELQGADKIFQTQLSETQKYLLEHPEINEVIFTGGDPFMISDEKLQSYLQILSQMKHIKFVRFHSRMPIVTPQRLTDSLLGVLGEMKSHFAKLIIVLHINHKDEWTPELEKAVHTYKQRGLDFLSQTVLLKDINDTSNDLVDLFQLLAEKGISPYYLHHPDQTKGAMHFTLPIENGRKIYAELQDKLPGWAIPKYVLDIPHGKGKTQIYNPEQFEYSGKLISKDGLNEIVLLASENSSAYNKEYGPNDINRN